MIEPNLVRRKLVEFGCLDHPNRIEKRFFFGKVLFEISSIASNLGMPPWSGISIHSGRLFERLDFRFENFDHEDKLLWSTKSQIGLLVFPSEELVAEFAAAGTTGKINPDLEAKDSESTRGHLLSVSTRYADPSYKDFVQQFSTWL